MRRFPELFDSFFHFPGYMDSPHNWAYFNDDIVDEDQENEDNDTFYYE